MTRSTGRLRNSSMAKDPLVPRRRGDLGADMKPTVFNERARLGQGVAGRNADLLSELNIRITALEKQKGYRQKYIGDKNYPTGYHALRFLNAPGIIEETRFNRKKSVAKLRKLEKTISFRLTMFDFVNWVYNLFMRVSPGQDYSSQIRPRARTRRAA